jgi:hypothetical protein
MSAPEATLRGELERRWSDLEDLPAAAAGGVLTMEVPVTVSAGSVLLGVGRDGRRLLAPLAPGAEANLREDRRGGGVRFVRRGLDTGEGPRWFAELVCLRGDLNGVFGALCVDVLARLESAPRQPERTLHETLGEWRALFSGSGQLLSVRRLAGLFGELTVLLRLLERSDHALAAWVGPQGDRHDFTWSGHAVECKTSLADEGRRVRVHGLDQLEPPDAGRLLLAFLRVDGSPVEGVSVPELVERALPLVDGADLMNRLELVGYRPDDAEHYSKIRFTALDDLWFEVEGDFPGLTTGSFVGGPPTEVTDVDYTLDLSRAVPLGDEGSVEDFLGTLPGE